MYLNVDLGEEIKPNLEIEKSVMPYIHACNIACGGHAGNSDTIHQSIVLAQKHGVIIGAHPSYPDRKNFGRASMNINDKELILSITSQLLLFQKIANEVDASIQHIKLHGALYNDAAYDERLSYIIIKTLLSLGLNCTLLAPTNSILSKIANLNNIDVDHEIFGDRNYNDDLTLVSRSLENALITNPNDLFKHINSILKNQEIQSITGKFISTKMETLCMHSDHDKAIDHIKLVSKWIRESKK